MHRVTKIRVVKNYCLSVEFEDGTAGEIDLKDRLYGPMFEPLKDPGLFNSVFIDEYGVICWQNGADIAPDALHHLLAGNNQAQTRQQL